MSAPSPLSLSPFPMVFEVEPLPALAVAAAIAVAGWWWRRRLRLRQETAHRRRQEAAQRPLQSALTAAQQRIRDFGASQGSFVLALAEELRAPLGLALDHAELLLVSSSEPKTVERYANGLVEDLQHLSGLVDSYLRLAQPAVQADHGKHVPVHVHDVLLAAAQRCQYLAAARAVKIVPMLAEVGDGSEVEVLGDSVLLEAMLESLVRNGILASPRGATVGLQVQVVGDEVRVAVHDTGPPLPPGAVEDALFGFFPLPSPARRPITAGLSLAVAMRVAEHHHGSISLSNSASGCKCEVQLPRWHSGAPVAR